MTSIRGGVGVERERERERSKQRVSITEAKIVIGTRKEKRTKRVELYAHTLLSLRFVPPAEVLIEFCF